MRNLVVNDLHDNSDNNNYDCDNNESDDYDGDNVLNEDHGLDYCHFRSIFCSRSWLLSFPFYFLFLFFIYHFADCVTARDVKAAVI